MRLPRFAFSSVESPHGYGKSRVKQALLLCGSYDFERLDDYRIFVSRVIVIHNKCHAGVITARAVSY